MDNQRKLWLPVRPSDQDEIDAIEALHPPLIDLLQSSIRGRARVDHLTRILKEAMSDDLKMQLIEIFPDDPYNDEPSEEALDSYEEKPEPKPIFEMDMYYKIPKRTESTDRFNYEPELIIDHGTSAEALAGLEEKTRATIADMLIYTITEELPFLRKFVSEEPTEKGDTLDYEAENEEDSWEALVKALLEIREQIKNGTYGILPEMPHWHEKDLLGHTFPHHGSKKGKRRRRW